MLNPITTKQRRGSTSATSRTARTAVEAFAYVRDENGILDEIREHYKAPIQGGNCVMGVIHGVFGAFDKDAVNLLRKLDGLTQGELDCTVRPPWTARTFFALHAQRISLAVQREAARQIHAAARTAADEADSSGSESD